jgi:hypothetical protein
MIQTVIVFANGVVNAYNQSGKQVAGFLGPIGEKRGKILSLAPRRARFFLGLGGDFTMPISRNDFVNLRTYEPAGDSRMPRIYKPPLGLPFNYHEDSTGELPRAVMALLDHLGRRRDPPTALQLHLITDYLAHYIHAPCWEGAEAYADELKALREDVGRLSTPQEIWDWQERCMDLGMSPL